MADMDNTLAELEAFRKELDAHDVDYRALLRISRWRPWVDMMLDVLAIGLSTALVIVFGYGWTPLAILVIGNRQRALGNLLHDAAHRTLHRTHAINDGIGRALLAPLAFVDLRHYRVSHFQHHMQLGRPQADPDYLPRPHGRQSGWFTTYARFVCSGHFWWRALAGHLGDASVPPRCRLRIAGWWIGACALVAATAGAGHAAVFLILWMASRATAFHLITTFREMCDHYGLAQGSVLSFTRDVMRRSFWYDLVHPRSNGYHLTHHLLPAVPYYRLPLAQQLFHEMPSYRSRGRAHGSYILGPDPVVATWSRAAQGAQS